MILAWTTGGMVTLFNSSSMSHERAGLQKGDFGAKYIEFSFTKDSQPSESEQKVMHNFHILKFTNEIS